MASSSSSSSSSSFSRLSAKARPFVPPTPHHSSSKSTLSAKAPPFTKPSSNTRLFIEPYVPSLDDFDDFEFWFRDDPASSAFGDDILEPACNIEDFPVAIVGPCDAPFKGMKVAQLEKNATISSVVSLSKSADSMGALPEVSTLSQKLKVAGRNVNNDIYKLKVAGRYANNDINKSTDTDLNSFLMEKIPSSSSGCEPLTKPIKLSKNLSSESVSAKENISMENSPKMVNQIDLDVDSPCWKGTLAYGQSKDNLRTSEAQDKEASQLDGEFMFTDDIADMIHITDIMDITNPESAGFKDAVQKSSSHIQCSASDVTSSNVTVESHCPAIILGKPSSAGEHAELIDETLQCLHRRLLSRTFKDENSLKKLLDDILLLANDYPEAFVHRNKKGFVKENLHDAELDFIQSQITELECCSSEMEEKSTHLIGPSISDKFDNLPSDPTIIRSLANDFDKILRMNFSEREENPRALLHKNLWIEAQVKLLTMKYELQLAQAKCNKSFVAKASSMRNVT